MNRIPLFFLIIVLAFLHSCCSNDSPTDDKIPTLLQSQITLADTITYDVMLRALDEENIWEVEQLKYLNREAFVSYIFDGIYSNRFRAFDFFNGKPLSTDEVKKIDATVGFAREKVTKVQFKELWYVDTLGTLQKHVHSYTLGIEAYSNQNTFIGHKALFTVKPY